MEEEEITPAERAIQQSLAASALGPLARRQESIAQTLTEDQNLSKLHEIYNKQEPESFSLESHLYDVLEALHEAASNGDDLASFNPPLLRDIIEEEYRLRVSLQRKGRRELVDMTRIFERGEQKGGGLLFWRRGRR